ncbi:hypothetical protein GGI12_004428 [Dipsacomyces acuminosporus]|nr:hypothetical protein GGI12_004428 [Dipsacomyces acuminosporus]
MPQTGGHSWADRNKYYNGPRPWAEGTERYKIRLGVMMGVYGLYTIMVIVTLALFIIKSRNRHSGLSQRNVTLVVIQSIGGFLVGSNGLISTAFNRWPCFIELWLFNIGLVLNIAALSARAVQLIVTAKIHSLNSQLARYNELEQQQQERLLANESSANLDPHGIDSIMPAMPSTLGGSIDGGSEISRLGSTRRMIKDEHNSKTQINVHQPTVSSIDGVYIRRRLQKYTKFGAYVTDRAMYIYLGIALLVAILISLFINIFNPRFRISPPSEYCPLVWGFLPVSCIVGIYLIIICPSLLALVWDLNDAYGIRTDLIVCDTLGIIAFVVTIIWSEVIQRLKWAWSVMFFMWVASCAVHISSVAVPLFRAIKHTRIVARKLQRASMTDSSRSASSEYNNSGGSRHRGNSKNAGKRSDFNKMLEDSYEYRLFRSFAASCFCSELTAFIDEYQTLKALTVIGLEQTEYSALTGDPLRESLLPNGESHLYNSLSNISVSPGSGAALLTSVGDTVGFLPSEKHGKAQTSPVVSILETARAVYPEHKLADTAVFPPTLMDKLVSIFSIYINSTSYTSVNVPPIMVRRIRDKLDRREMYLTILDEVKDEVLFMLFADVYTRYTRK